MNKIAILVKTYIGDINYVKRLIPSFNKFNVDNIPLYIIVPKADLSSFKRFIGRNIKLFSDESITKDLVYDNSILGIRPGYINQEIIKLAFWEKHLCKNYFCMDSDGVFIRKFYISDFMYDENIPYTIIDQDNELMVDPEYFKKHWVERERSIKCIQKTIGLIDKRMLTCHGFAIFSSEVLQSFHKKYLLPNNLKYKDILRISPYEFSWYNMWLQKDKTIRIEFKTPLIKFFHQKSQHLDYLKRGITIKDIARGYIGYNINSNYSRGYGVVSYSDGDVYRLPVKKRIINLCNLIRLRICGLLK